MGRQQLMARMGAGTARRSFGAPTPSAHLGQLGAWGCPDGGRAVVAEVAAGWRAAALHAAGNLGQGLRRATGEASIWWRCAAAARHHLRVGRRGVRARPAVPGAGASRGSSRRRRQEGHGHRPAGAAAQLPQPSLNPPGSRVSAAPRLQAGGRAGRRAGSCAA